VSGVYLWLPRTWNRAIVRMKIFFNPKVRTTKARDFNWHHVFAVWAVIPLFFLVATATVFYFPWANEIVYGAYGEETPERRRGGDSSEPLEITGSTRSKAELLGVAKKELEERGITDWKTISMQTATSRGAAAKFRIDRSIGGQPGSVYNLEVDGTDGSVTDWRAFADNSPGTQARFNIRFLHTGEVFGIVGQTIAGLASLAACFLVWTGLALAWRRLVRPLFQKRRFGLSTT
jgi:uncharacterized iron-regulated membrane protein